MQGSESSADENLEKIPDDATKFDKSLQELRDLRSQLHHAAGYCETTFQNATDKRTVVESTKEYLCRALVTVVDHLGSVSANLECQLSKSNSASETELRMDSLKQRLLMCQQYSHKVSLRRHCWNADFPRYCSRYLSPPTVDLQGTNKLLRKSGGPIAAPPKTVQFVADEEVPLFLYTYSRKESLVENSKLKNSSGELNRCPIPVLPVHSGLSAVPKSQNPYFQFQDPPSPKLKTNKKNVRFAQTKGLVSLIRRRKRTLT